MNVKVENLEKNTSKIIVEVPAEEFEQALKNAYNKNKGRYNIPGFRKGKAPQAMIEKLFGTGVFYEDAVNEILDKTYPQAMKESGLDIVSRPEINIDEIKRGEALVYTATVATKPPVELGQYKGISVEKADASVSAKEVNAELKRVQEQNARIVAVEDPDFKIRKNDIAYIDFEGFVDGVAFEGGKGENYPLTIGSGSFIPGFEEQLIGHKAGDELDVNVTFPENYQAEELKGKAAVFKCKVNEIKYKELPELDDDFAGEVSEFETLKEYKASIKADLKSRKEKSAAQTNENNVLKAAVDNAKVEIPAAMIDMTVDNMVGDMRLRLQQSGLQLEQYLGYLGQTMEQYRETIRPEAEVNTKTRLVLDEIVKQENITVSDEALDQRIEQMAQSYKMSADDVRRSLGSAVEDMRKDLACQEAIDLLVAEAVLTEPEKKSSKGEAADAEDAKAEE